MSSLSFLGFVLLNSSSSGLPLSSNIDVSMYLTSITPRAWRSCLTLWPMKMECSQIYLMCCLTSVIVGASLSHSYLMPWIRYKLLVIGTSEFTRVSTKICPNSSTKLTLHTAEVELLWSISQSSATNNDTSGLSGLFSLFDSLQIRSW